MENFKNDNFKKATCPICNSELIDSFELFCPNENCCFITEIPNIANENGIIPLLYENDELIQWIEILNGKKSWYLNGFLHREDGPAIECRDDSKYWYVNGKLHREDGPAVEYVGGAKAWYLNGKLHREVAHAVEYSNGSKFWYLNGIRHREDGPAIEYYDGYKEWYLNGKLQHHQEPACHNCQILKSENIVE